MSFCFLYNVVLENYSVQNSPWGEGGVYCQLRVYKGLGSIRGVFGHKSKISLTLSNYRFVIWDNNYRRYFVI